jgi:hypothetical protein
MYIEINRFDDVYFWGIQVFLGPEALKGPTTPG